MNKSLTLGILTLLIGTWGCKQNIEDKQSIITVTNTQTVNEGVKQRNNIPSEQLKILMRKNFDKSILTYDTSTNKKLDSIPIRLMELSEINKRIPWKKQIAGYKMTRSGVGYEYRDKHWHIRTTYPGVIGYYPSGWGDYAKKVEYRDANENIINVLDFDKLTPYNSTKYKNIKPGAFDFESMNIDSTKFVSDFKSKAVKFIENRRIFLFSTTDWVVANYILMGLDDYNNIVGYETTIEVYNPVGIIKYSSKLPYDIQYPFISTDEKYLVFAPSKAKYMPEAYKDEGVLFIYDLLSKKLVYSETFNSSKIRFGSMIENYRENLLSVFFSTLRADSRNELNYSIYYDLNSRKIFSLDQKTIINSYKKKTFSHPLEALHFKIKSF